MPCNQDKRKRKTHPGSSAGSWQCNVQVLLHDCGDGAVPEECMERMLVPPLGTLLPSGFSIWLELSSLAVPSLN